MLHAYYGKVMNEWAEFAKLWMWLGSKGGTFITGLVYSTAPFTCYMVPETRKYTTANHSLMELIENQRHHKIAASILAQIHVPLSWFRIICCQNTNLAIIYSL